MVMMSFTMKLMITTLDGRNGFRTKHRISNQQPKTLFSLPSSRCQVIQLQSSSDINFDSIPMMGFEDDDDNDSIIISLIKKENDFKPGNDNLNRLRCKDSEFLLRNEAINWIWKACAHRNFGPLCLYLSMNYLDRFLTSFELPGMIIGLLADI